MPYFTPETDSKIDWEKVSKEALARLEKAREIAKTKFVITSTFRNPAHSQAVGGSSTDAHTRTPCSAFDIAFMTSNEAYRIIHALMAAGFPRIGINMKNHHIHCDCETSLPMPVFWVE